MILRMFDAGRAAVQLSGLMSVFSMVYCRGQDDKTRTESDAACRQWLSPMGDFVTVYRTFTKWQSIKNGLLEHSGSASPESKKNNQVLLPSPLQYGISHMPFQRASQASASTRMATTTRSSDGVSDTNLLSFVPGVMKTTSTTRPWPWRRPLQRT